MHQMENKGENKRNSWMIIIEMVLWTTKASNFCFCSFHCFYGSIWFFPLLLLFFSPVNSSSLNHAPSQFVLLLSFNHKNYTKHSLFFPSEYRIHCTIYGQNAFVCSGFSKMNSANTSLHSPKSTTYFNSV